VDEQPQNHDKEVTSEASASEQIEEVPKVLDQGEISEDIGGYGDGMRSKRKAIAMSYKHNNFYCK